MFFWEEGIVLNAIKVGNILFLGGIFILFLQFRIAFLNCDNVDFIYLIALYLIFILQILLYIKLPLRNNFIIERHIAQVVLNFIVSPVLFYIKYLFFYQLMLAFDVIQIHLNRNLH